MGPDLASRYLLTQKNPFSFYFHLICVGQGCFWRQGAKLISATLEPHSQRGHTAKSNIPPLDGAEIFFFQMLCCTCQEIKHLILGEGIYPLAQCQQRDEQRKLTQKYFQQLNNYKTQSQEKNNLEYNSLNGAAQLRRR